MCSSVRPLFFSDMKEWSFTTIKHAARKELDISPNEYCVLDYIYQTQTNPKFTRGGWCRTGIHVIAQYFGFSTGTVHKMFARFVERGLLEIDATDAQSKKTTAKFYETAYLDSVQKVNEGVQKVNSTVQKVNTNRSKSEHIIKEDNSKDNRESAPAQFLVTSIALETIPDVEGEVSRPAARPGTKVSEVQANPNAFGDAAEHFLRLIEAKKYDLGSAAKFAVPYFRHKQQSGKWIALCIPGGIQEEQRWIGEHMAGVRTWAENQVKFDRPGAQPTPHAAVAPTMRLSNPENAPR